MDIFCPLIVKGLFPVVISRNKSYEVFCRKCSNWFPGVSVPSLGEQISSSMFFVKVEVTVIPVCSFRRNTG
jgi:hypothetical protein